MNLSLLCETVTGTTTRELVAARDAATRADMVELRLDGVTDPDVGQALHGRRVPVIVTCRPTWEGGRFDGTEEERRRLLRSALESGAEHVDIEWRADFADLIRTYSQRVVVSSHDFSGVPGDLCGRARAMRATGAAVIKVAITAERLSDTLPLLEIAKGGDAVVIGMGDAGMPSRLLAARFGSRWTYSGKGVAPGQLPTEVMLDRFRFRDTGADSAVYGVVGDNVSVTHSRSPVMHNAAFAATAIDAVYVPLRAADFDDFLTLADGLGVAGASVTIPFKQDALRAAGSADALTRQVGAANTLRRQAGAWAATNSDVEGFLEPLDAVVGRHSLDGMRASVLGAGGAARAVIVALRSRGALVTVHARRSEQATEVAASLGANIGPWPPLAGSWDLLVNCTPLGSASAPAASPLPGGPFDGRAVYDVTYGREMSPLVRDAMRAGCVTLDGLPMLVAQAERQFEWWTGQRAPAGVMKAAALSETAREELGTRRGI
jgi:3-dehydroquinate dehydratase/shikimate dehydrogenase